MPKIIAEFEVSPEFIEHCQRIQKKYGMGPQQFLEEAIYFYQTEYWSAIRSVTVDSLFRIVGSVIPLKRKPRLILGFTSL